VTGRQQWQRQSGGHGGSTAMVVEALDAWWQHWQSGKGSAAAARQHWEENQTDIHHLWILARRRGDASGDARNRGGRRNALGDASLDNGKEERDLRQATINRGGRRNVLGGTSLDNGKEEGDALGDASNAPPR
jgi:hypothetical protein